MSPSTARLASVLLAVVLGLEVANSQRSRSCGTSGRSIGKTFLGIAAANVAFVVLGILWYYRSLFWIGG